MPVEFGTAAHVGLLEQAGLLQPSTRILPNRPSTSSTPLHDALIIDDYFAVSAEDLPVLKTSTSEEVSEAILHSRATAAIRQAKRAYKDHAVQRTSSAVL